MKPAPFDYLAPRSAEEAIEHLAQYGGDARLLAGGQSLIALLNLRLARPAALIDLGCCAELDYLRREGQWLVIGPMTRQTTAEHSPLVREHCQLMARAMPFVGPPVIRNRGTIGGTLAHADRVAELPGVALALDASFIAQGPKGKRSIAATDFFVDDLTTALAADEMLREVRFPISAPTSRSAFVEASNRHHDLAIVGIALQLDEVIEGRCAGARIAAVGLGAAPVRLSEAERRLTEGRINDSTIADAAAMSLEGIEPDDDLHAAAEYRRMVTPRLVERALRMALAEGPERRA